MVNFSNAIGKSLIGKDLSVLLSPKNRAIDSHFRK